MKLPAFLSRKVHPQTVVSGGRQGISRFSKQPRDLGQYENIYRQGGLVSTAIDAYPLFGLNPGYTLSGAPIHVKKIEAWFKEINFEQIVWQAYVDSLVYGDSIQENVFSRGGDILYVVPRNPLYFTIDYDKYGIIKSYTQTVDNKDTILKPEQVTHLQLLSISGETYGQSLIARAFNDIDRDTVTAESTAEAIERHGHPKWHIKVGSEGNIYSDEEKRAVASEFEELKADHEIISNYNVEILALDTNGVANVMEYNEWSLSRLLASMGVPSGVIGTGENKTTMASATVEMKSFILRVETFQKKVARCYNGLIDLKLKKPGLVTLEFNLIDDISEPVGEFNE